MSLDALPEREIKTTTGFSLFPSTLDKLDTLCDFLQGNRSQVVEHLIQSAFTQLQAQSKH